MPAAIQAEPSPAFNNDSEDDFDWEEVEVPLQPEDIYLLPSSGPSGSSTPAPNIEITIRAKPKQDDTAKKRAAEIQAARVARLTCHKAHTLLLLANARTRNKWINDELLRARLMSLTPIHLQNAFAQINRSRYPDALVRGHMFQTAVERLVSWWKSEFKVLPTGHIRSRTFEEVQEELARKEAARNADRKGKGRARDVEEEEEKGEIIRGEKSLMKHALMGKGSRDTSAQLFTALCRALGIPARLVVSLQSVPWQAKVGKPKTSPKKSTKKKDPKGKQKATEDDEDEDDSVEEVDIPTAGKTSPGGGHRVDGGSTPASSDKGKQKAAPVINLRKSRGRKLGTASPKPQKKQDRTPDPTLSAPVFWTEVFSRADAKWLPVDPIRGYVNKRNLFDPSLSSNTPAGTRVDNRMVYVVAFEEDGYARDVTPRYAREFGAKVAKIQHGGKGKKDWWESVMRLITRPFRLNRDDLEDEELQTNQLTEKMPETMSGFKNHPLYALERHLRRDEVVHPLVELGKFRGEPVYPRANVLSLKTAENWMRQGRKVREGCQPMKWVKQNAVTVNRRRALEMALAERDHLPVAGAGTGEGPSGGQDVMQGLYAESQTELYVPDPVVDGKVPKNDFGNIDLYVPTMLPAGAVYIPHKGAAKTARQLGFDYAEAVTGFEFKKRRAYPLITGIVVAAENEQAVLEAYWEAEQEAEEKRRTKEHEQVIKRWQRLIRGLRIRQRLQEEYGGTGEPQQVAGGPAPEEEVPQEAGGFLTTADDVVKPYTLPRNLHEVLPESSTAPDKPEESVSKPLDVPDGNDATALRPSSELTMETFDFEEGDGQPEEVPVLGARTPVGGAIKSMAELALAHAQQHEAASNTPVEEVLPEPAAPAATLRTSGRPSRRQASTPAKTNGSTKGRNSVAKSSATKQTPRRGRKRARSDDESAISDEDQPAAISPAKRSRTAAAAAPVKSDRVLRSRRGMTDAQKQAEREAEEAFGRAIEE